MNAKTALLLCASFITPASMAAAQTEFHASSEFSIASNEIKGAGKTASSLTKGLNYLEVLNVYGNGTKGAWNYSYTAGGKATDDLRNDSKKLSLTNIQGRATNNVHTITVGDVFESFSQYSLATSLKGGSYRFLKDGTKLPEVTGVFGWAYPRWDSFWKDPATRSITRQAAGLRLKQAVNTDLWAAGSYVAAKDTGRLSATDALYDAKNYTFDFGYNPIPGLTLAGEHSMSDQEEVTAAVSAKGNATRIELTGDADPSRVSLEYENVDPDFYSALGSASTDRRKVKARWRYKHSKRVTVTSGLLWYRNNLDSGKTAGTTSNWKPEISAAIKKPFPSRPYSFADLSYKFDRKYGGGSSGADHYMNANYRDRYGALDSDSNLGYTLYKTRTAVRDAREVTFNTSLNSRHQAKEIVLKPSVNLGAWYAKDELADETDKLYEYSLGLGFEAPEASFTGDLRLGRNMLRKSAAGTDDSNKFFAALSAYWRPKLSAKLKDSTIFLRAGFNDYAFTTTARNFREKSVTAGINTSF
ncbi:MAG: hypothetical protein A2234_11615 [Elusimicrobia bacterium RIFOXYA2_FULL_58_8]|nr:MAG: hypothetical protein A2285_10700 [Elusimicrobia bacterium RIFOXYA12_FULL_57_11]OGS14253.1 MAG: hypothetical protein A2234_11615 [Elusimicrobia bacterium RIFOXYA2_FULL_58_8]